MDSAVYNKDSSEAPANIDPVVSFHERIIRQVNEEYWAAWWFHRPRVEEWQNRLKLYNNQKREKSRVGTADIFSFHQALLAKLYEDKLAVQFNGRREKDEIPCELLTGLAANDYDDMEMAQLDYEWDFDASLYGRGLMMMNDWDYHAEHPLAEVIDPLTWLRDPNAQSVNGNAMGFNGMRFGGREIRRTEGEMREDSSYFNLDYLKKDVQGFRTFSPLWDTERARKEAQGFQTPYQSYSLTTNLDWTILQWFTIIDGKKYMLELGNERQLVVRMIPVKSRKWGTNWPIIDRAMYPIAHDWDGVSVFDIMEDKQRFRSQLINVYGDLAKAKLYDMWLYDENKIRKHVDMDFEFSKRIPVDGDPTNAAVPLKHSDAGGEVNFMLDFLDKASMKALGINEQSLGLPPTRSKTKLGQNQMAQQSLDARYSLVQRIWGWSETMKWRRWHELYQEHFTGGIAKKILRTEGPSGKEYEEINPKDIEVSHSMGPQISVETKSVTEAKKTRDYMKLKDFMGQVFQLPETDKLFGMREIGKLVMPKRKVMMLLPYTFDESYAQEENEKLNNDEAVKVQLTDNHTVHLRIHQECEDTPAVEKHIKMHHLALLFKRAAPQNFPQMSPEGQSATDAAVPSAQNQGKAGGMGMQKKALATPAAEGMGTPMQHA